MLLDVNCLLAIAWPNHQHHRIVSNWFEQQSQQSWSTCTVTELGFVRLSSNPVFTSASVTPPQAISLLSQLIQFGSHSFIDSSSPLNLEELGHSSLQGHRQVTDSYLIALARSNNCRLATLDKRLRSLPNAKERLLIIE